MHVYPPFWQYMKNQWTLFEKLMYSSSLLSSVFSIAVSYAAYRRDHKTVLDTQRITPLYAIRHIRSSFLYDWPPNLKILMITCMIIVIMGNYFLYLQWRQRNKQEILLPYDFDNTKGLRLRRWRLHTEKDCKY